MKKVWILLALPLLTASVGAQTGETKDLQSNFNWIYRNIFYPDDLENTEKLDSDVSRILDTIASDVKNIYLHFIPG